MQIVHIWVSPLGAANEYAYLTQDEKYSSNFWSKITSDLARELGVFRLAEGRTPFETASNFLSDPNTKMTEAIDFIEMSFAVIDGQMRSNLWELKKYGPRSQTPDEAIAELNHRFLENSVGHQYLFGKIVRRFETGTAGTARGPFRLSFPITLRFMDSIRQPQTSFF